MKKILSFTYSCLALLIFSTCESTTPLVEYTIEGYIYEDCGMTPYSNTDIELFQEIETDLLSGNSTGGVLATSKTDANGYFKFSYIPENDYEVLIQNGGNAIIGVPIDTNIVDLVGYNTPTCNIQVSLNVMNVYTSDDTLYCTNLNDFSSVFQITGPFTDGLLYVADGFQTIGMHYKSTPYIFRYKINGGPYGNNYIDVNTNLIMCDTNSIVLDIY